MVPEKLKDKSLYFAIACLLFFIGIACGNEDNVLSNLDGGTKKELRTIQVEQCGVAAVHSILSAYYGNTSISNVIEKCPKDVFKEGMSLSDLEDLMDAFPLRYKMYKGRLGSSTLKALEKGCCLIIPYLTRVSAAEGHLIVCFAYENGKLLTMNPPKEVKWIPLTTIKKGYDGICYIVSPDYLPEYEIPLLPPVITPKLICAIGIFVGLIIIFFYGRFKKRWFSVLMIIMVLTNNSFGKTTKQVFHEKENEIRLEYDLGLVDPNSTYTHKFEIINDFKDNFTIKRVAKSCGCLDVVFKKDSTQPGDSLWAEMTLKVGDGGYFKVKGYLIDNKKLFRKIKLTLRGNAKSNPVLVPSLKVITIKQEYANIFKLKECIEVHRLDRSPLEVESIKASNPELFKVKVIDNGVLEDSSMTVLVEMDISKYEPTGQSANYITILTRHEKHPALRVPIVVELAPKIISFPSRLFLGRLDQKQNKWVIEFAQNTKLDNTKGNSSQLKCSTKVIEHTLGESFDVISHGNTLELKKKQTFGNLKKFVKGQIVTEVKFNEGNIEKVIIPVIGYIK